MEHEAATLTRLLAANRQIPRRNLDGLTHSHLNYFWIILTELESASYAVQLDLAPHE